MAAYTHLKYDLIPYPEWSIFETQPSHLGVIGRLFGINTPASDSCRVLELGCASGGNLIPAAYYWPDSEFVGIELSRNQVEHGNALIAEIGLRNLRILHRDIMHVDKRLGQFDYIIIHGVYSWVPEKVQNRIMRICRELLSTNGLAYISYNTMPGWSMRNMMRAMILFNTRKVTGPRKQLRNTQTFIQMLASALPQHGGFAQRWLQHETTELVNVDPDYLFHEYLEEDNHPIFFHEFMQRLETGGLRYVADATLATMLPSSLTPEANVFLDSVTDLVDYEQYMDFFQLRHFRQSIVCHRERSPRRLLNINKFRRLHLAAYLTCDGEIDLQTASEQQFTASTGRSFSAQQPLTKAALVALTMAYPDTLTLDQVTLQARDLVQRYGTGDTISASDQLTEDLLSLFLSGALQASITRREIFSELSDRPLASPLARVYAKHKKKFVVTAHHDNLELDYLGWKILSLADGKRKREEIYQEIIRAAERPGAMRRYLTGKGLVTESLPEHVTTLVEAQLYQFAGQGLLSA